MTTTENFQDRWAREKAEKQAAYRALYLGVASRLPAEWTLSAHPDEYDGETYRLTKGEQRIHLNIDERKRRVTVSGSWPSKGPHGPWYSPRDINESGADIGVGLERGHEAIAGAIIRRFLPEYDRVFGKLVARREEHNAYQNRKRDGWDRLKASVTCLYQIRDDGQSEDPRASVQTFGKGYGDVRMGGEDSVTLELRGIPVDMAIRMLNAVKEQGK